MLTQLCQILHHLAACTPHRQTVLSVTRPSLAREVKDLNDKADSYKFYPVVQVGLSYRF